MVEVGYVTQSDFDQQVIQSTLPVLVDFTAVWCGPCKMLAPVVAQLARQWHGKLKVVKLDVDENPEIAMQFGIMGVPTLILFQDGKQAERVTGYQPKDRLEKRFAPYIQ